MRKAVTLLVAATSLAALTVATPNKAKACGWECWAIGGAVVVGGALIASSAYSHGYYAGGGYGPHYGHHGYYAQPVQSYAPTYGYYQPPYYDYGPAHYRPAVRYVKRVRYVREQYVEPDYYEQAYYPQQRPRPNYVRVRY